jgi:cytidyltransferase-like protein
MRTFKQHYNILNEGGAAGHMAHPFDLPSTKTGNDLINFFKKSVSSVTKNPPSVKIDGVNASFRLIDTEEGKEFALDRGSMKPLDLQGITIDKLVDRFGEGHGMVNAGQKLLSIMNEAIPDIEPELKKLGLWENANRFFNTEFVEGQTNVLQYDNDFLAIHGINEFVQATPRRRASKEVNYNPKVLQSLIDKLNKFAEPYGFKVYGSVPAELTKNPNFENVLSKNFNVIVGTEKTSKPLRQFLADANNPFGDMITLQDGKKVGALSKFVYMQILNGVPVDTFVKDESDYQKAIDGAVIYHATRLLGDELLTTLTSPMGDVKYHEGIVIRDPKFHEKPVKITGEFIVGGMASKFRSEDNEIAPYYSNYINNPPVFNQGEGTRLRKNVSTFGEMVEILKEFEDVKNYKTVVIYPGRFHPFHKGHASVYNKLKQQFPTADVFITTSDKQEPNKSPFSFEEKKIMMQSAGVDPNDIKQSTTTYSVGGKIAPNQALEGYDLEKTKVIFAGGERDVGRFPDDYLNNPDTPLHFYKDKENLKFGNEDGKLNGYLMKVPTVQYNVLGEPTGGATDIRNKYKNSDEKTRRDIIMDLYGSMDEEVKRIFDNKLV